MRIALLIPLLALGLGACSSSDTGQGARGPAPLPPGGIRITTTIGTTTTLGAATTRGSSTSWIKKWWSGLDPERQQEIREKYQDWQENPGQPDVAALRGDLASRWNAMTPAQQQALRDNRQNRPSISNPGNSPRSPLDDRGGTLPRTENRLLSPGALPKADNALLTPSTQPKVDARPTSLAP